MTLDADTERRIDAVVAALTNFGNRNVIALSGVAGTGKTMGAIVAAERWTGHPLLVRQIQFHPSYAYEDFVEGLRPLPSGGFEPRPGILLEWNTRALNDPENRYALVIEEFTRAEVAAVMGELLTYVEHRERRFRTPISRSSTQIATNLGIIVTYNPRDRSALELDDAIIRRLRVIEFPPSTDALRSILAHGFIEAASRSAVERTLVSLFDACRARHPETFEVDMPFGHGVFAGIRSEEDLRLLWREQLKFLLRKPRGVDHAFTRDIEELYPWR